MISCSNQLPSVSHSQDLDQASQAVQEMEMVFSAVGVVPALQGIIKSYGCEDDIRSRRICEILSERWDVPGYWENPEKYLRDLFKENQELKKLIAEVKYLNLSAIFHDQEERQVLRELFEEHAKQMKECIFGSLYESQQVPCRKLPLSTFLAIYSSAPTEQIFHYSVQKTYHQNRRLLSDHIQEGLGFERFQEQNLHLLHHFRAYQKDASAPNRLQVQKALEKLNQNTEMHLAVLRNQSICQQIRNLSIEARKGS